MLNGTRKRSRARHASVCRVALIPCVLVWVSALASGCASSNLASARANFFLGRYDTAAASLIKEPKKDKDRVLFLMERGMIRQAAGAYTDSAHDWLDAHLLADRLDYFSVSKQSTSMLINDSVLSFRGMSYERSLLHAFAAKSYFALSLWDDAAVEARNNIGRLEQRGKYPDDPYSRYMNGFCLEMSGDRDGARVQYNVANTLLGKSIVETTTGKIGACTVDGPTSPPAYTHELICFVGIGRPSFAPGAGTDRWRWGPRPYARVRDSKGVLLGRSISLNTTDHLSLQTRDVNKVMRGVKTVTRIAVKEIAAEMLEDEYEFAGELLRVLLFALEQPDNRRWQTLPEWLQVVRVPCPADLDQFSLEFVGMDGRVVAKQTITTPVTKRGNAYVSFARAF